MSAKMKTPFTLSIVTPRAGAVQGCQQLPNLSRAGGEIQRGGSRSYLKACRRMAAPLLHQIITNGFASLAPFQSECDEQPDAALSPLPSWERTRVRVNRNIKIMRTRY